MGRKRTRMDQSGDGGRKPGNALYPEPCNIGSAAPSEKLQEGFVERRPTKPKPQVLLHEINIKYYYKYKPFNG